MEGVIGGGGGDDDDASHDDKSRLQRDRFLMYNLSTGLDLEHIKNPTEILRFLLKHYKDSVNSSSSELVRLELTENDSQRPLELPSLGLNSYSRDSRYSCKCPKLSIDKQRIFYLTAKYKISQFASSSSLPSSSDLQSNQNLGLKPITKQEINRLIDSKRQLEVFGGISRNNLAKRLAKCLRFYRKNKVLVFYDTKLKAALSTTDDFISLCLYKLEQFVREANENLENNLACLAEKSSSNLYQLCQSQSKRSKFDKNDNNNNYSKDIEETRNDFSLPIVMVKAPLADYTLNPYLFNRRRYERLNIKPNHDWDEMLPPKSSPLQHYVEQSDSTDSGIDLEQQQQQQRRLAYESILLDDGIKQIDQHMAFRASRVVQSIIDYSIDLFAQLLIDSSLFKLTTTTTNEDIQKQEQSDATTSTEHLISLAELKLYACVECQKLRSSIRFQWITKCLEFVIQFKENENNLHFKEDFKKLSSRRIEQFDETNSLLPVLELNKREQEEEERYYDLIALLMGQLLRQHFLAIAFEKWLNFIDRHQFIKMNSIELVRQQASIESPKVMIKVNLVESTSNSTHLACSNPNKELKEALNFIVDELASICRNLPRIETQSAVLSDNEGNGDDGHQINLTQIKSGDDTNKTDSNSQRFIVVLQNDDNLLDETKLRLSQLIDGSQAVDNYFFEKMAISSNLANQQLSSIKQPELNMSWNHPDYLLIIDMVNRFRTGSEAIDPSLISHFISVYDKQIDIKSNDQTTLENEDKDDDDDDDRLKQLRFGCKQIVLLNHLEQMLNCKLNRYFDFGFALLDCEPLSKSLIKCINSERSLLVKLNMDDLLKLMERLRLQFDEIELGIDLETAIDDYLNERWQAKQSQQPQQQSLILASGGDNINDEDDNQLGGEEIPLEEPLPLLGGGGDDKIGVGGRIKMMNENDENGGGDDDDTDGVVAVSEEDRNLIISKRAINEEEEFVTALNNGNSTIQMQQQQQKQHQFFALRGQNQQKIQPTEPAKQSESSPTKSETTTTTGQFDNSDLFMVEDRRVAPLIECQLLVEKYEYFSDVLNKELEPLVKDLQLAFEGLIFLSEFVDNEQLELSHSQLIAELSIRSQEFTLILSRSLKGLNQAKARLIYLNLIRSKVLSKLVAEFHLLMIALSKRRLLIGDGSSSSEANESSGSNQLDFIQEASDWSQKLELRFDFLQRLNVILAKEAKLLSRAYLKYKKGGLNEEEEKDDKEEEEKETQGKQQQESTDKMDMIQVVVDDKQDEGTKLRAEVLEQWRHLVACISCFWRLAEKYEAQQVKWLNSDTKRIDFKQIESAFNGFVSILEQLKRDVKEKLGQINKEFKQVFEINLRDLEAKFDQFFSKRLPIFKFLTNRHLKDYHWLKLSNILSETNGDNGANSSSMKTTNIHAIQPQHCTTLAQFLELNVDKHVDKLEEMNKQAIIEHELSMFLLAETEKISLNNNDESVNRQMRSLNVSSWLENWSDKELVVAASRFIEAKMNKQSVTVQQFRVNYTKLAEKLIAIHSKVKQYLHLKYTLNLDLSNAFWLKGAKTTIIRTTKSGVTKLTLRSNRMLTSSRLVRPSLFVEFLRLFTQTWIEGQLRLSKIIQQLEEDSKIIKNHLRDIEELIELVRVVNENDLYVATKESEQILVNLERETLKLELEREILATKEALALERQRDALKIRDECIRQITERAIPAIRAATRALDCLDDKSLRTLRCIRPNPPESVKLVIEAVCLLKSCSVDTNSNQHQQKQATFPSHNKQHQHQSQQQQQQQVLSPKTTYHYRDNHNQIVNKRPFEPERRLDATQGKIIEDYWPVASRMLNGTHSCKFVSDLRKVDKKSIPTNLMRLIRRKYLSSDKFNLRFIEKVSIECALLAKWLIAVDVFDRVINVVKPNYKFYIESEKNLGKLLNEVNNRRREIENISNELQKMEDLFEVKVKHKMNLTSSLEDCKKQLKELKLTQLELLEKESNYSEELRRFERKRLKLAGRCLLSSAETVYIEAMLIEERKPMTDQIRALVT